MLWARCPLDHSGSECRECCTKHLLSTSRKWMVNRIGHRTFDPTLLHGKIAGTGQACKRLQQGILRVVQVSRVIGDGRDISFSVRCSKGTYIRALAHDLVRPPPQQPTNQPRLSDLLSACLQAGLSYCVILDSNPQSPCYLVRSNTTSPHLI